MTSRPLWDGEDDLYTHCKATSQGSPDRHHLCQAAPGVRVFQQSVIRVFDLSLWSEVDFQDDNQVEFQVVAEELDSSEV